MRYPFRPLVAIPCTKYFWTIRKKIAMGTIVITAPAITRFHWVRYRPCRVASPTGSVITSVLCEENRGHRKAFHEPMNEKTARVARAGLDSGNMMREKIVKGEAPSR